MLTWVRWMLVAVLFAVHARSDASEICQFIGQIFEQGPQKFSAIKGPKQMIDGEFFGDYSCKITYGTGAKCTIAEDIGEGKNYDGTLKLEWLQSDLETAIVQAERLALLVDECGLEGPRLEENGRTFVKWWKWTGPGVEEETFEEATAVGLRVIGGSRIRVRLTVVYWYQS